MTNAEIVKRLNHKDQIISKKIIDYGRKCIKDEDNVMALELCIIVSKEISQLVRTIEKDNGKNAVKKKRKINSPE